jgi:uncharacterized protein
MQQTPKPLTDAQISELDERLASIHAPLQPMDASALDGYLCGVLLQPVTISFDHWLPLVFDIEGLPATPDDNLRRIAELARCRHAELAQAISQRRWFDPWIFETEDEDDSPNAAKLLWVAGFAAAWEHFPGLSRLESQALLEPLAVLYSAFDLNDLDDAQDLLEIIETLEPPGSLAEAAEDLVRSVLLMADVSRPTAPVRAGKPGHAAQARRPGGPRRPR